MQLHFLSFCGPTDSYCAALRRIRGPTTHLQRGTPDERVLFDYSPNRCRAARGFGILAKTRRFYPLQSTGLSVAPNSRHFIEHRHDQSVFNLLIKERGLYNYEMEPADNKIENPIWYCRNRNGSSIIVEKPY